MQQLELITIENPCINVCQSNNRGYCLGCYRSRDERFKWAKMTQQEKRKTLELCKARSKRRKVKQKKANHQTDAANTIATNAVTKEQATDTNKPASKENPSCLAKSDESVQDMGLDLFDL